jgi:hypothetical protein
MHWWSPVTFFVFILAGAGSVQAEIPDGLLGRWVVTRLGAQAARVPYKFRLYSGQATFPSSCARSWCVHSERRTRAFGS